MASMLTLNKRENFYSTPWILGFWFFVFVFTWYGQKAISQCDTGRDLSRLWGLSFLASWKLPTTMWRSPGLPTEEWQTMQHKLSHLSYNARLPILSTDACKGIILDHPAPVELPAPVEEPPRWPRKLSKWNNFFSHKIWGWFVMQQ